MTSAWKEPPGRDDRAEGQDVAPDENQLELFETLPRARTDTVLPPEADLICGGARHEGDGRRTVAEAPDLLDVGGTDSTPDELRRLEDSIRWLMNESSMRRMPRATTLPPVRGLPPVESFDDDDLLLLDPDTLLNPDALFPSQSQRRHSGVVRGAAKMLLVSAVAAPTAYFIANWVQFPDSATPSESATISDSATISGSATIPGLSEERLAAVAPAQMHPSPEAAQTGDNVSAAPQPEPMAVRGTAPGGASAEVAANPGTGEPKGSPEQPPGVSATPSDPAPGAGAPTEAQSSNPPSPGATPAKPARNTEDVALLLQRGRALFEAGDIAAARLFFRRAANAGDAAAAVAMGATYDPDVLAKRFIRGIEADAGEARIWYEKARALGSPEGPRRIEMLAQRQAQ